MKPAAQRYVIGVDVGSQGMKTVLVDASGHIAASSYAAYDAQYPAPNRAEENPADWETALVATIRQVMREAGAHPSDVAALPYRRKNRPAAPSKLKQSHRRLLEAVLGVAWFAMLWLSFWLGDGRR